MSFYISGTGSAVPEHVLTNEDLSHMVDTNDEWISTRTGIKERRIITKESLRELAVKAGKAALDNANVAPEEIDLLLISTLQGDMISPSLSCLVAGDLGIKCTQMSDVNMACCGFVFALDIADSYFKAGKAKKALVISAEAMSRVLDWTDRSTCVLFGDSAGAVVLEEGEGFEDILLTVKPEAENLSVGIKGNLSVFEEDKFEYALKMNGPEIYIFAVSSISRQIKKILAKNSLTPDDVGHYILHQANLRIIESARQKLKQPAEKVPHTIEKYGNTSSSGIPVLLDEVNRSGVLKDGEKIVLCGFGAGLTTATCLLTWKVKDK